MIKNTCFFLALAFLLTTSQAIDVHVSVTQTDASPTVQANVNDTTAFIDPASG